MLKSKMKVALVTIGAMSLSWAAQADQATSNNASQQAYVPGEIVKTGQLPAGYNASATFQCDNPWDIFVSADYIYWAWQQESLEIAALVPDSTFLDNVNSSTIYQNPGYASGFQVGAGFNMGGMDDWNLYSEYTWYENNDTASASSTSDALLQFNSTITGEPVLLDGKRTSQIKMNFDELDFLLKRPFYFGKKLTANFSAGLKALWITQKVNATISGYFGSSADDLSVFTDGNVEAQKQTSWGLGPKFGFETNWMLGYGLQIMANISTSVLYTRYNLNTLNTGTNVSGFVSTTFSRTIEGLDNLGTLRPVTEAFLGLGWSFGLCDDSFRIALSAGYDFNVYWNYNMTNYPLNGVVGSMYLQGLNVGGRFDF